MYDYYKLEKGTKNIFINSDINISFVENYKKNLDDTIKKTPLVSGDMVYNFGLDYTKNVFSYKFSSSYSLGYYSPDFRVWKKVMDQINLSNSMNYSLKKVKLQINQNVSSQLLNNIEDELLVSSFMSPGTMTWSLGFNYDFDKWLSGSVALNFASVRFIIFVNQKIYRINEINVLNDVEKGKYITTITGFNIDYNLNKKFCKEFNISNSGQLFFPGEGKLFSKGWLNNFNANLNNEISYSLTSNVRLSLQTKLEYNNYQNKNFSIYNKLAIGITFK